MLSHGDAEDRTVKIGADIYHHVLTEAGFCACVTGLGASKNDRDTVSQFGRVDIVKVLAGAGMELPTGQRLPRCSRPNRLLG